MAVQELLQGNPESQATSGASTVVDPEKHDIPLSSRKDEDADASCQQQMSKWRWFSICVGFCLGAMLYGMMTTLQFWYQINH
jgi:hypothetical protein